MWPTSAWRSWSCRRCTARRTRSTSWNCRTCRNSPTSSSAACRRTRWRCRARCRSTRRSDLPVQKVNKAPQCGALLSVQPAHGEDRRHALRQDSLADWIVQKVRSGTAGRRIRNMFSGNIGMNLATRICCITLAVGIAGAMPAIGQAASADGPTGQLEAPQAASEAPLLELEEVLVHGKRLQERIVEAEDEFYKLFNQVNKDDDYDTNCALLNLSADSGSRLNSRLCLPVFVAEAIADYTVF